MYLCGGIGTFAQAIKEAHVQVAHHIDVEIDETSRKIAAENHRIDHTSLPQDITNITSEHIQKLRAKYGRIHVVIATTPCQGFSKANKYGRGLQDPRSALFIKAISIIKELREADPATRYIAENVDFKTSHPEDYRTICEQLGEAEYIDAKHTSGAARKRLFWHNLGPATEHPEDNPIDANTLLEPGSALDKERTTAPCLMAAWRCAHKTCRKPHGQCTKPHEHARWHHMSTHNPVIIYQDGQARHIRPEEAERLMGLPTGYTATTDRGRTAVAGIHRLQRIGGSIDVRSVQHLLKRLHSETPGGPPTTKESTGIHIGNTQTAVHEHVAAHREWNTVSIAKWLTPGPIPLDEAAEQEHNTWEADWHMRGAADLIRCCTQGFPLRYEGDRERDVEQANGMMCQNHPEVTATELQKEVAAGRILGPYESPPLPGFKCVPRASKRNRPNTGRSAWATCHSGTQSTTESRRWSTSTWLAHETSKGR